MTVSHVSRFFASVGLAFCLFGMQMGAAQAKSAKEIDVEVEAAMAQFRKNVKGAEEYLASAKDILVMPEIKKVGFIVGGRWGAGPLQISGKMVEDYRLVKGSLGFQAGYQEALDKFRQSEGWTAGGEAGLTVVDEGVGGDLNTLKGKSSVLGFVFGKKGLMGGYSFKGEKSTKFKPE